MQAALASIDPAHLLGGVLAMLPFALWRLLNQSRAQPQVWVRDRLQVYTIRKRELAYPHQEDERMTLPISSNDPRAYVHPQTHRLRKPARLEVMPGVTRLVLTCEEEILVRTSMSEWGAVANRYPLFLFSLKGGREGQVVTVQHGLPAMVALVTPLTEASNPELEVWRLSLLWASMEVALVFTEGAWRCLDLLTTATIEMPRSTAS